MSSSPLSTPSVDLFLDTLSLSLSQFQSSITKLLTSNHPVSNKLQDLSLDVLQFKCQIYQMMSKLLSTTSSRTQLEITKNYKNAEKVQNKGNINQSQIIARLGKQYDQTMVRLRKMQLYAFLKKKIRRAQRQSMINSMQMSRVSQTSNKNTGSSPVQSSFIQMLDPSIQKLKSSMILIQKDLGIQPDTHIDSSTNNNNTFSLLSRSYYNNGHQHTNDVSVVIHRSMASLEITPIKKADNGWTKKQKKDKDNENNREGNEYIDADTSMNSSVVSMDISIRVQDKEKHKNNYNLIENYQINGQPKSILQQLKDPKPSSSSVTSNQKQLLAKQVQKQKLNQPSKLVKSEQIPNITSKAPSVTNTNSIKQQSEIPATATTTMTKKKKVIVSSTGNNEKLSTNNNINNVNKGMFSNLLQQSLQSCIQNNNKDK